MENEQIRNEAVTIGTTQVTISPQLLRGQRNLVAITNTSTGGQIISLSFGSEASPLKGAVLYPAGSWSESVDSSFIPTNEKIAAVSSAAGGTIAIHERIRS